MDVRRLFTRSVYLYFYVIESFINTDYQSVLELEAAVQRNPVDASVWFELGVKQQENERESKAIQALRRSADIDPQHLPTWLALAVSYTNDGNRQGTYDAIKEWVDRNVEYESAVKVFRASVSEEPGTSVDQFSRLIECLMSMARSNAGGEIDADIQIALAVLLNTNEVSI
jgi:peroxin-5